MLFNSYAQFARLEVVSERLGYSNIAVTMDTYSHVLPGLQEAAANTVDQCLVAHNS